MSSATNEPLHRADGVTQAERYLKRLCDRTFLSLWSYPGIFRDQYGTKRGDGKEVCDVLVVCWPHIIIFSDKNCKYPNTGNDTLDWCRWFRKAIQESSNQVYGAERWIRTYPGRLFLDRGCKKPFPLEIPDLQSAKFHRVVVAHNVSQRCQARLGGTGTLMLDPFIVGKMHYDDSDGPVEPFTIGQVDPSRGYVHVFDDSSLNAVLMTVDTITDFTDYLTRKERLIVSGKLTWAAGEDDLLAYYLGNLNEHAEHDFVIPGDTDYLVVSEGLWTDFYSSPKRLAKIGADEVSYIWDKLIETFNKHIFAGTSGADMPMTVAQRERVIRLMARESRFRRRVLASAFVDLIRQTPVIQQYRARSCKGPGAATRCRARS